MKALGLSVTALTFALVVGCSGGMQSASDAVLTGSGDVLGLTTMQLNGETTTLTPMALQSGQGVEFVPGGFSVVDDAQSSNRYLNATFYIRNKTNTPLVNLTLYALHRAGKGIGGSAIRNVFNQGGQSITNPSIIHELRPAHAMNSDWSVNSQGADFQAIASNEALALQNLLRPGTGNGNIGSNDVVLEYGYVGRSIDGTKRSIAVQPAGCNIAAAPTTPNSCYTGKVSLGIRVPKTGAVSEPYRFVMDFVLKTDDEVGRNTRITQSREETLAAAIARAQAFTDRTATTEIANIGAAQTVNTAGFVGNTIANLKTATMTGINYLPEREMWSDRFTWPNKTVPAADSTVDIPLDKKVLLDVSPPTLSGLSISGDLAFADKDLTLSSRYIMVHGKLGVGSSLQPFTKRAILEFTGFDQNHSVMGMGTKGLLVMGGVVEMFGEPNRTPWTRLAAHAAKGATTITVLNANNWRVGDQIAIASTDYNTLQAERFTIQAITGNTITLSAALKYNHFGQTQTFGGKTLESRAEVALLSRNITVRGEEMSSTSGFGAHIMLMSGAKGRFQGIELMRVGQKRILGRYPIHYHMLGDGGDGSFIKDTTVWNSFNRCYTIHGTNKLVLQNNVGYDALGHCYFLEDGAESNNVLEGNLGFLTREPEAADQLLASDNDPATFWITHPQNTFRNNVAGGSQGTGFWYALPEHPTGASTTTSVWNRRIPLGVFEDNLAHSNSRTGLNVDNGPKPSGVTESTFYNPRQDPNPPAQSWNETSPSVPAVWKGFQAYRNRTRGVWLRGHDLHIDGAMLADHAIGATFASVNTSISNSVMVGETDNLGTPENWEKKGENNRTLPFPWNPGMDDPNGGYKFPIRGYEFYDGLVSAKNVTFVNFQSKQVGGDYTRPASALSYLRLNEFSIDANNFAEGLQFINANRVYQETPINDLANSANNKDGNNAAIFFDKDGSITGTANRYVTSNNPFLTTGNCTFNSSWNAHVCNEKYTSFNFSRTEGDETIAPVLMTRNDDTSKQVALVSHDDSFSTVDNVHASLILGKTYTLAAQNTPNQSRLRINERQPGDWVIIKMPWSQANAYIYRDWWVHNNNRLAAATNQADFDASTGNKYLLSGGVLSMKMQVQANRDYSALDVCKNDLCK
jgi:cell surface hyaluronidase